MTNSLSIRSGLSTVIVLAGLLVLGFAASGFGQQAPAAKPTINRIPAAQTDGVGRRNVQVVLCRLSRAGRQRRWSRRSGAEDRPGGSYAAVRQESGEIPHRALRGCAATRPGGARQLGHADLGPGVQRAEQPVRREAADRELDHVRARPAGQVERGPNGRRRSGRHGRRLASATSGSASRGTPPPLNCASMSRLRLWPMM